MTENRLFDVSPQGRSPQSPLQGGAAPRPRRQSGRSVVALGGGHGLSASLSALRLLWRLTHRPPALPARVQAAMPGWQRVAHHGTHFLMYALFFAVPLLGWAYSSAAGFPIVWFGALPLPDLLPKDKALADAIKPWHAWAAFTLAALVVLHVAAVVKHELIDRDGLLSRMLPGR